MEGVLGALWLCLGHLSALGLSRDPGDPLGFSPTLGTSTHPLYLHPLQAHYTLCKQPGLLPILNLDVGWGLEHPGPIENISPHGME